MPDAGRSLAPEVLLQAEALTRRWGGLVAVDRVNLTLQRGEVHAVIGTNGAGKSTLINLLSGEFPPSAGTVRLHGQDITAWPQPRRARAGLGRSYQRNTIYPQFTVLENCRLSAQARAQQPWRLWASAQAEGATLDSAHRAAQRAGLGELLGREAGSLSHGQKRQLEIAMCLATAPQVLLLDEPLAGMGADETERMLALLAELKQGPQGGGTPPPPPEGSDRARERPVARSTGLAILLVEHDMDAVFRIADRLTVMVNGAVIATGDPEAVRRNPDVQTAYLGGH